MKPELASWVIEGKMIKRKLLDILKILPFQILSFYKCIFFLQVTIYGFYGLFRSLFTWFKISEASSFGEVTIASSLWPGIIFLHLVKLLIEKKWDLMELREAGSTFSPRRSPGWVGLTARGVHVRSVGLSAVSGRCGAARSCMSSFRLFANWFTAVTERVSFIVVSWNWIHLALQVSPI